MAYNKPGYEFFDHTADVGLRASGTTIAELFRNAALGFTELIVEHSKVNPIEVRSVTLRAASVDALLKVWLTELIVWFDIDGFIPATYDLKTVTETSLNGAILGERFDPKQHIAGKEVKAVTHHQLLVEHTKAGWQASVIFDI